MLIKIIVLIVLIIINGFFSSSEIAFLSINKYKLKKEISKGDKKAIKIKKLIDSPSSFLATIQIAITLAGFLASAIAAETFTDSILDSLCYIQISQSLLKTIILFVVTLILSYFTLVFGELVPKRIGMSFPKNIAYSSVNIIILIMKILYPFVWLLTKSTNLTTKLLGVKEKSSKKLTKEEVKYIISTSKDDGVIEAEEKEFIFNFFDFEDTEAYQIMTPKKDVISVDINIEIEQLMQVIQKYKYTRIPVYSRNKNSIVGILNIKDILVSNIQNNTFNLKEIIRKPFFVNKHDKADDIFKDMQKQRKSISIVMEKGNFVGLITLEDAIEEIVGNIFDEFDNR